MKSACGMAALIVVAVLATAQSATASVTHYGYVTSPDGASLSYTVLLPSDHGRFPVAMLYDGYASGSNPLGDSGLSTVGQALLARGFALLGVNVPGTGCSGGKFMPVFRRAWAQDGAFMVNWAAMQRWSTGKVGMFGTSFPAFMAMYVAGEHPRGLAAVATTAWTGNFRDAVYQGGMFNEGFPNAFDADVFGSSAVDPPTAASHGDVQCQINFAEHESTQLPDQTGLALSEHPYVDDFWSNQVYEIERELPGVKAPLLTENAYQDGVASGSGMDYYSLLNPKTSWFLLSNGTHDLALSTSDWMAQELSFFEQFVAGQPNGWEQRPHVQIWRDTYVNASGDVTPRAVTSYPQWPPPTTIHTLHLRAGGILSRQLPTTVEQPSTYEYPRPAGSTASPQETDAALPDPNLWATPIPGGGNVTYTTPRLDSDLDVFGPSSLNLWISSTATNTDVQVTVSEVRPDGKEQYIDRGWLRLSERKLSPGPSGALWPPSTIWPRPTYLQADVQPLVPGQPTFARIPIYPFEHLFRKGSSIRISIEAPEGATALATFDFNRTPATVRVWHDPAHESEWVFPTISPPANPASLPACGTVVSEDCRTNTQPVPAADGPGPLAADWKPSRSSVATPACVPASGSLHVDHLGPLHLGESRARARRSLARYGTRGRAKMDFYCLSSGPGIRAGYPTPRLMRSLRASQRKVISHRVILLLTANRRYALHGVRPGTRLAAAKRSLRLSLPFTVGRNRWYFVFGSASTGVLKVRRGLIGEVGIASKRLTNTTAAAHRFITSWHDDM